MAEENEQAEPSMEDILVSIRRILSEDEEAAEAEAPAPAESEPEAATEAAAEPEPEEEMDMAAAMEPEPEVELDMAAAMEAPEEEMDMAAAMEPEPEEELDMAAAMEEVEPEPEIEMSEPEEEPDMVAAMEAPEPAPAPIPEPEPIPEPVVATPPPPPPPPTVAPPETLNDNILELTQQMIAQAPPDIGAGDSILSQGPSANSTDALQELAKALLSKRDIAIGNRDMTLEGLIREILRPLLREWLDQNLPYLIERLVKKEIDHMVNRAERLDL